MLAALVVATFRDSAANYVQALATVYTILIIAYIFSSMFLQFGRVPYNRYLSQALGFLRDICEPYLRIFRRFIPAIGPIDVSPIVAIVVLQIGAGIIARVIQG
jgi:YggT family protein